MQHYSFISKKQATDLLQALKLQLTNFYQEVIQLEGEICALGVFTDSDVSGFALYYNTTAGIEAVQSEYDDLADIIWWMPEWVSENNELGFKITADYLAVSQLMEALYQSTTSSMDNIENPTFPIYKREMFDLICEALSRLKAEGLFQAVTDDFLLLVQESDNGVYDGRAESLGKIMTAEQLSAYLLYSED